MDKKDGMNYAPSGKSAPVVREGDFQVGIMHLDHGHINGMANGLKEAGASLKWVFDPYPERAERFRQQYPEVRIARSEDEILQDPAIQLVAAAAVTSERAPLGIRVLDSGKDYFTDKAPLTTLDQLEAAKAAVDRTGHRYWCYFSERLHVESAVYAGQLVRDGVIGDVLHVTGFGPHRLNASSRPDWFFQKEKYGGILCDIGSHQIEQFLFYAGSDDAEVVRSQTANFAHPEYPELEDFGEAMLVNDRGASQYFRVDWFTPDGLDTWGDGRLFIIGTEGFIELRKYTDIGRGGSGDDVFFADKSGEHHINVHGQVGFPFFGEMILDVLNGSSRAMTQEHIFKAAELACRAQLEAVPTGSAWRASGASLR